MPLPGMPGQPPAPPAPGAPPGGVGGMPPNLSPQSSNLGGLSQPQGNPGNAAQGMLKARALVKQMEEILPTIPMDSPLHEKLLKAITSLHGAMPDDNPDMAGPQSQGLLNMIRQMSQKAPMDMLAKLGPQGGGASAPPVMAGPPPAAGGA